MTRSDDKLQDIAEKYDVKDIRDLPRTSNIRDYYSNDALKKGREYREGMFFNMLPSEQHAYARKKQEWMREFKKRGFDVNDHDVQDACDYNAGTYFINWLNNLDEMSSKKHYYYRNYKFKKYFNFDENSKEIWSDFDTAIDDFFDTGDLFDDMFGDFFGN